MECFTQKYLKHLNAHSSFIWWVPRTSKTLTKRPIQHPSAKWVSLQIGYTLEMALFIRNNCEFEALKFQGPKLQKHIVGYLYIYTRLYTQYISISHYILMIYLEYVHPWMVFPILIDQKPKTVFLLAVPFSMQKNAFSHDFPMIPH